jgi:hypothetical protein
VRTYQSLAVKAVLAIGQKALEDGKWIEVDICATVYTLPWRMLKPQSSVDDATHVRPYRLRPILVKLGKGQVEQVTGSHEVAAIAFDECVASL